jgi:hypothetical protein
MQRVIWKNEVQTIQKMVDDCLTMESIGEHYGVSKQRVYQVCQKFNINTPLRKRKSFLENKGPSHYWLNHTLIRKTVSKFERDIILKNLKIPTHCPMLDIELNYLGGNSQGDGFGRTDFSPSLDQIVPSKGYVLGNIQIISWRANRIKNDATPEELIKIAKYMEKFL